MHGAELVVFDDAFAFRLDDRRLERLHGHAADVEGAHGELGARLPDGLRRDDADGFADLHHVAGRMLAPVALRADAALAFASKARANLHALMPDRVHRNRGVLFDELILLHDELARHRVLDAFA